MFRGTVLLLCLLGAGISPALLAGAAQAATADTRPSPEDRRRARYAQLTTQLEAAINRLQTAEGEYASLLRIEAELSARLSQYRTSDDDEEFDVMWEELELLNEELALVKEHAEFLRNTIDSLRQKRQSILHELRTQSAIV